MKNKSRVVKLILIIIIGLLVVYGALNLGEENDSAGGSGVSDTSSTLETSTDVSATETSSDVETTTESRIKESGEYTSKEDVAEYIYLYKHLPDNYITKEEAKELGWVSSEGNLWEVAPGKSIGGDYFGNYEGLLPKKDGRQYYECDIDFEGSYRGEKRIIYSNDGLIYYTDDHYESFEKLYGEE